MGELPLEEYHQINWQQDGAPAHSTMGVVWNYLNLDFEEGLGRNGIMNWSANCPVLTLLEIVFWENSKTKFMKIGTRILKKYNKNLL